MSWFPCSWYHGRLSRTGAEKILQDFAKHQGFLVRESMSKPGVYVLSYYGVQPEGEFSHFRWVQCSRDDCELVVDSGKLVVDSSKLVVVSRR